MVAIATFRRAVARRVEAVSLFRAEFTSDKASVVADATADHTRRNRERELRQILVQLSHRRHPNRESVFGTCMTSTHSPRRIRTDPHAHRILLREADVPRIRVIVRRTGLTAARMAETRSPHTAGRTANVHVLEHIDHQVSRCRAQDFVFDLGIFLHHLAIAVHDRFNHVRLDAVTAVREHRVSRRHFHKRSTHRTKSQARNRLQRSALDAELASVVHHVAKAVLHTGQNCRKVLGLVQSATERHHAFEVMFEVTRAPNLVRVLVIRIRNRHRLVVHRVAGASAVVHCGRIDDRLERRTRLAQGLHGTVPLGLVEVATAHHGTDCTSLILNNNCGYFSVMITDTVRETGILATLVANRISSEVFLLEERVDAIKVCDNAIFRHVVLLGKLEPASRAVLDAATDTFNLCIGDTVKERLNFRINRTVDGHAIGIERIFAILLLHILAYFFEEIKARSGHIFFLGEHNRFFNILAVFLVRDIAGIAHSIEHSVTTALGSLRMTVRAIRFGALQHACEHGVFRDRKAIERLAEVVLACRLKTVVTASEVNFVHVEFEDFFLRVGLFDADSRHHFLDLTGKRAFRREEEELGKLLRQSRCTAELVARDGTLDKRRRNRPYVHAPVLVESTVFGRHHGMDRIQWN